MIELIFIAAFVLLFLWALVSADREQSKCPARTREKKYDIGPEWFD